MDDVEHWAHCQAWDLARRSGFVVLNARPPYPMPQGSQKWLARGQTQSRRYIQVIYVFESDARGIDWTEVDLAALDPHLEGIYVIHARPLDEDEKRSLKKKRKRQRK